MNRSLRELSELAERTCYVNSCVLYSHRHFEWLKPYLLLFDTLVLDHRHDASFQGAETRQCSPIWPWLEQNAIFLSDFEDFPTDNDTAPQANPMYLPPVARNVIVTKKGYLNRRFLRTFAKHLSCRGEGATDWSRAFEDWNERLSKIPPNIKEDGAVGGANTIVLWFEIAAAWSSFQVSMLGGPPSVLDPLSSWLVTRIYRFIKGEDLTSGLFNRLLIQNVPDFEQLPWSTILDLRNSRYRRHCLRCLQSMPDKNVGGSEQLHEALWKLATEAYEENKIPKTILKGIGGNLPIPPVNPLGLALSIGEILQTLRKRRYYGWVYYLAEIRHAVTEQDKVTPPR